MTNLRHVLRDRLLEQVVHDAQKKGCGFGVLVCDEHTIRVVSSLVQVADLNEHGVGTVLDIGCAREKLPSMSAIYFISPSKRSLDALIHDTNRQGGPQYKNAYVYLASGVSDDMMTHIANSGIASRLKAFVEVAMDVQASESRVCLFGRQPVLDRLFESGTGQRRLAEAARSAQQLVSLCVALQEDPIIKYDKKAFKSVPEVVAEQFEHAFAPIRASQAKSWPSKPRATLVLVDRSIDPVSPLMHEFTYQAMIHDLLPVDGQIVTLTESKAKEKYLISDEEDLFRELRNEHISTVSERVTRRFNEFKSKNATAGFKGSTDIKDLKKAAKSMIQYKGEIRVLEKHFKLGDACFDAFEQLDLRELSNLEQNIATGIDENGDKVKKSDLQTQLSTMLQNPKIRSTEKVRLLMIYIAAQGGVESRVRKQMFELAGVEGDRADAILNLTKLGIPVQVQSVSKDPNAAIINKERTKRAMQRKDALHLELMRWRPVLEDILEDLCDGALSSQFGTIQSGSAKQAEKKVGRSLRVNKWKGDGGKSQDSTESRVLVFMAGGLSFSEVRAAYDVSRLRQKDILLISTHMLTAENYIADLAKCSD